MHEGNQFLKMAIATHGVDFMLMVKMSLTLLIGLLVWGKGPLRVKSVLNCGLALVLLANCALVCRPFWSLALFQ